MCRSCSIADSVAHLTIQFQEGMTMNTAPATIDDVTAAWVAEATGLAVTDISTELIGVGIGVSSAVYRLTLTGTDVPDTLVLKLPALDEAAVFTSSMLRLYYREVKFFDELASESPIKVPRGYGGGCNDDGTGYYLFMEDMGGHRIVDQLEGMEIADAEEAVDELAKWHAQFWGKAEHHVETGAAVSIADDVYRAVLPLVFAEGWDKVQAEMDVHPTIADVASRWLPKLDEMLDKLSTPPTTVLHGDYRADNIFFDSDGKVVLLDFQITGLGTASSDLAYFITQSLLPEVAAANEQALFDRYIAGLIAAGVPEAETGRLWEDYRVAALFCLVYPIVASRGMDLTDPRQYELINIMNQRCARAVDDLDLRDLL
jgi:aminoglycoside phosphotransferase (APT) family kinase protein